MTDKDKDLDVVFSEQVNAQMAADPVLAEFVRGFAATLRQAHDGVKRGQYKTMDAAVESITGNRPEKIDPETGDTIEGASMNHDLGLDDMDD